MLRLRLLNRALTLVVTQVPSGEDVPVVRSPFACRIRKSGLIFRRACADTSSAHAWSLTVRQSAPVARKSTSGRIFAPDQQARSDGSTMTSGTQRDRGLTRVAATWIGYLDWLPDLKTEVARGGAGMVASCLRQQRSGYRLPLADRLLISVTDGDDRGSRWQLRIEVGPSC
jgi:hypothetical protein